jgi:dihydrofolate reductase
MPAPLIYAAICSLDGYVEDEHGRFDWARPDAELHAYVNALERETGTALYGRGMWETMRFWAAPQPDDAPAEMREYGEIWRAADKVVYSATLDAVDAPRTRLEPAFDPDAVRRRKAEADRPLSIGGATIAGAALAAGLVDEIHLFLHPVVVGGGKRALPDGVRLDLALVAERRFASGVVHLHHRVVG